MTETMTKREAERLNRNAETAAYNKDLQGYLRGQPAKEQPKRMPKHQSPPGVLALCVALGNDKETYLKWWAGASRPERRKSIAQSRAAYKKARKMNAAGKTRTAVKESVGTVLCNIDGMAKMTRWQRFKRWIKYLGR